MSPTGSPVEEENNNSKADLAKFRPTDREDFLTFDQKDEEQILAEIRGETLNEYIYKFKSKGKEVVGLSYAGVKAVIHNMKHIHTDLVEKYQDEKEFQILMKATDKTRDISVYAGAQQAKMMETKRRVSKDYFALAKAVSKAQRNAWRHLIPEAFIAKMVKTFLEKGKQPSEEELGQKVANADFSASGD